MRVTVKICGLTSPADAEGARRSGADFLGFVFFPLSRRCLQDDAFAWVRAVAGTPKVGVFRDQPREVVERVRDGAGLDLVQLHGCEPPGMCEALGGADRVVKAISVADRIDWRQVSDYAAVARILFDTATSRGGGSGVTFDWDLLRDRPRDGSFWLAGGLNSGNVERAIRTVRPAGVDVASGVEREVGRKDAARMQAFVAAVRAGEAALAGDAEFGRNGR